MTNENPTVIVSGARTPFGRLMGGLSSLSAPELGGVAIRGALDKGGVPDDAVDAVIMGQVLAAGGLVLGDRVLALLHHLLEHGQDLRVVERDVRDGRVGIGLRLRGEGSQQ